MIISAKGRTGKLHVGLSVDQQASAFAYV